MAISYVGNSGNAGSSGTVAVTTGAVAVNDLLLMAMFWTFQGTVVSPVVTDTVNSGSWNLTPSMQIFNGALNLQLQTAWIRCDHSGTPTITASNLGANGTYVNGIQYTGFLSGPSLVSPDITVNSGSSTTPAALGFTNSAANELTVLVGASTQSNLATPTGSFTPRANLTGSGSQPGIGDVLNTTSGNAVSYSGTASNGAWAIQLFSFIDGAPPSLIVASLSAMNLGPG